MNAAKVEAKTEFAITDKAKLRSIILKGRADGYCITRSRWASVPSPHRYAASTAVRSAPSASPC